MSLLCLLEGFLDTLRMGLRTGEWTPVSGHTFVPRVYLADNVGPAMVDGWRCERCGGPEQ